MKNFIAAAAVLAASCGGSSTPTGNPGESPTCSITLSGAITGTYDCRPATTVWSTSNNQGGFGFAVQSYGISVAIGWPGEPSGGAHKLSSGTGATGGVTVQTGSGATTQVWSADVGGSSPHGTYDLYFTGLSATFSTSQGKAYTADGTLSATLVPLTGQSGNVTVSVTF